MVGHPADPGGRKSRRNARRPIHPGLPPNPDPADFTMPNALACSNLLRCSIGPVFLALFLGCSAVPPPRPSAPAISSAVPRPTDWRDQVIYFAMIERFADGDPANNDQGLGEYDPAQSSRYSGGDLAGITGKLDYIRGLGATAVWITPPVRHQWWDPASRYGGYHGYWTEHFMQVDPHFGDLDSYRTLARELHARDMRLIQDIVVNHVGNWFRYPGAHDPADPTVGYTPNRDLAGRRGPSQPSFDQNDPRDPAQRAAGIYHWTPTIRDATDRQQELTWQLADLDDLATEHPTVRRALCDSYQFWIREVGVDAFRVDTAFYVEPEFFREFVHGGTSCPGGMLGTARESGVPDFHLFGEGFGIDRPGDDRYARKIESYAQAPDDLLRHRAGLHAGARCDVCRRSRLRRARPLRHDGAAVPADRRVGRLASRASGTVARGADRAGRVRGRARRDRLADGARAFRGSDGKVDPLWLDQIPVLTVP
jgi:hypothetical protein